jgi:SMODS and SLOG-associating 2TM effector domain 1/SMODS and SLOG-associating 2TM effector domain 3
MLRPAESANLIAAQPERDWYAGRAIAESMKTLAWRYAVQGNPFGPELSGSAADELLFERIGEVLTKGRDRITISAEAIVTPTMRELRKSSLSIRRASYMRYRTQDQRGWYSENAERNATRARNWRYALLAGELLAVVLAALSLALDLKVDVAGITAALVAAGAAWLSLKQHSQLASAYRIAAAELALQEAILEQAAALAWPQAVADAEEAISREHTMWLASRGIERLPDPAA